MLSEFPLVFMTLESLLKSLKYLHYQLMQQAATEIESALYSPVLDSAY